MRKIGVLMAIYRQVYKKQIRNLKNFLSKILVIEALTLKSLGFMKSFNSN